VNDIGKGKPVGGGFSPRMRTPPMAGSMALKINAFFIWSCPTIAVNG
jgi:hypothetical protein